MNCIEAEKERPILLIGGGGHCRSVIDILEVAHWPIAGIIDTHEDMATSTMGYNILGNDGDVPALRDSLNTAFVTVGQIKSADTRKKIFRNLMALQFRIPCIISPLSYVSKHAWLNQGTIILHNVVVNAQARIGQNCIINTAAIIEHDCIIEDHCHISIGAKLCGGVHIGEGSCIGAGAIIRENVRIGSNCIVGMGCQVRHDLADSICYVG